MSQHAPPQKVQKPSADDRQIWDILFPIFGYPAVLVAHELKLFSLLAGKSRTLAEVCEKLKIAPRPAEAMLMINTCLGLLQITDGRYQLVTWAEDYLVESSPTSLCGYLDFVAANHSTWSVENVKKAVLTNSSPVHGGQDLFKSFEEQPALVRAFTRAMHAHSIASALSWPETLDLEKHRVMLDVGGGSGAHAIGACLKWPHLQAIVFDLAPVCNVAEEYIARYGLKTRVRTQPGDMWSDPFPSADLHFYGDIFHDWPPEKSRFLARKSFESLEPGGRIILREVLQNEERSGPLPAAAYNISMLLLTQGQQFSGSELSSMLKVAGFVDIEIKSTNFGYRSLAIGRKP